MLRTTNQSPLIQEVFSRFKLIVKTIFVVFVLLLVQTVCLAQFNRYFPHDRDSINTSGYIGSLFHDDNEIISLKESAEYHSNNITQVFQFYLERFDLNGNRLEQINLNQKFNLDTSLYFWVAPSLVKDPLGGYRFYASIRQDTFDFTIYSCWISNDLQNFTQQPLLSLPFLDSACAIQPGLMKNDPRGGYFFHFDLPQDRCRFDYPGTNMIVHLDEQGELDWYRTFDDNFPLSETIMDITRHPTTGKIYFCGNEANTAHVCVNNQPFFCDNYAFVYECDSMGYNCQRIYHEQDSVDAHQECNFIKVLSNGEIAVYHPIISTDIGVSYSGGTPRMLLFDEDGNQSGELLHASSNRVHLFAEVYFKNDTYQFIQNSAWPITGNENQFGQIYTVSHEVTGFDLNRAFIHTQAVYLPNEITMNSDYWINSSAMDSSGRILLSGRMYSDSLNTVLPYMVLSDEQGCFPQLPCTPLSVEEITPKKRLSVYPNPATAQFNLELEEAENVFLHNLDGRLVNQWKANEGTNTFHLKNIPPGIYFLSTQDGFSKLVVQ